MHKKYSRSFVKAVEHFNLSTHLPFCGKQLIIESWIYVEIILYSNKPYDHHNSSINCKHCQPCTSDSYFSEGIVKSSAYIKSHYCICINLSEVTQCTLLILKTEMLRTWTVCAFGSSRVTSTFMVQKSFFNYSSIRINKCQFHRRFFFSFSELF